MAFVFFLLYLIVIYLRPAEWIPAVYGWQLGDLTLIGTMLFLFFRLAATKGRMVALPHNRMMWGLVAAIAASHAVHTYISGMKISLVSFASTFLMYFLVVNAIRTRRTFQLALWSVIALTAILAIQGVYQVNTGLGWAGQHMSSGGRITWISIFNDPNDLGLAFVLMVPVLMAYLVKPGFFGLKVLPLGLLGLLVYGIYLTNSRGTMVGLMAAVAFFFIKRSRWIVPGTILGGGLASLLFLFGPSRLGLMAASPMQDESAYGRLSSWYYGFQLLKSSPLFGVGHNMFTDQYPLTAHNSFVLAAAELGLVGLFFWIGMFYCALKGLSRIQRHHPGFAPYAYGLQASLVGFLATAFFLSRTYIPLPYLICALSAALYHIASRERPEVAFAFRGRDVRQVLGLSLGSLLLVQIAMKTWL